MNELRAAMKSKLQETGIPFHSIQVTSVNILVVCVGKESSVEWSQLLCTMAHSVKVADTLIDNVDQSGTNSWQTRRHSGFMISGKI